MAPQNKNVAKAGQPDTASKAVATTTADEDAMLSTTALTATEGYEEFAGAGFENQTSDDYTVPFVRILQAISPILNERTDLKQGMLLNTVTGEGIEGKTGVAFVPSTTQHAYIEFKPREAGGGFVGAHLPTSDIVQKAKAESKDYGNYKTAEGNELTETFSVYGVVVDADGVPSSAVIAFSGAMIKKYKAWMTKAKTIQIKLGNGRLIPAPLFSHVYRLKTVLDKAPKGSFFNWDLAFDGENALACRLAPSHPAFQAAFALSQIVATGAARAAYESTAPDETGAAGPATGKAVF